MPTKNIKQAPVFPASTDVLFHAWLDSKTHGEMIGADAEIDPTEGGSFSIWDGEISGKTLGIDAVKHRIVQQWRYNYDDWPEDAASKITLEFVPDKHDPTQTRLHFWHTGIPDAHADEIEAGWKDWYWIPMSDYFSAQ